MTYVISLHFHSQAENVPLKSSFFKNFLKLVIVVILQSTDIVFGFPYNLESNK
jgi:hypothetical protein